MEIRTNAELARENLTLRHKYKMLKIKYNMVNKALNRMTLLFTKPTAEVKGEKHGH